MQEPRHFSLPEARNLLPWLEEKLTELDPYRAEIARCRQQVDTLLQQSRGNGHSRLGEEAQRLQAMDQELQNSIQDILSQIIGKGIIVRNVDQGLVDFPSRREERTVHLCWLRGEADITHWHETDAGFASRQPL